MPGVVKPTYFTNWKFVPFTVIVVPTGPLVGVKLVIVGSGSVTENRTPFDVPPPGAGLVTVTYPLLRPVR